MGEIKHIYVIDESGRQNFEFMLRQVVGKTQKLGLEAVVINPHLIGPPSGESHYVATIIGREKEE